MVFPANRQPPEILEPGKQTLHFPPSPVSSEFATILGLWFFSVAAVRGNHFNPSHLHQPVIQSVAVVSLVSDQPIRSMLDKTAVDGLIDQCHFVGRSTCHVCGDRNTSSVRDCHDLGALATLRLADSKTPFFAGTKVPSMKASRMSIPPRSYRSSASSWAMRRKTPWRTHCWKRRWQVWYGGYRCGRSFQGAPVRNIHRIASNTSRGSRGFLPRGFLGGVDDRIMGSNRFHCSFVSSIPILLHNQESMSRFFLR